MTSKFLAYVDKAEFRHLFIEELGWDQPTAKALTVAVEDGSYNVTPIAGFHGLHVWACGSLPDRSTQAQIDREVSAISTERLIIFHNGTKQEWRWPRYNKNRGTNMSKLLVHEHTVGTDHSALDRRLEKIALDIEDDISLVQLLEKMRTAFDVEESEESSKAARVMAKLYYELEAHLPQEGPEASGNLHKISVTMARILFLVFADDTMMWDEENLFQNFVAFETEKDGSDLAAKLELLFGILNTDKKRRPELTGHLARFKYVNGGIFSEEIKLPNLSAKMRELLIEASRFDWGNISPAIFGSMFQAVKSKELRRELGAHYTSEKDILKTLKPLFLDELHAEFERARSLTNPTIPLNALRKRLGEITIFDPACGCGNFLIVAYRELRELELQIMEALQDHRGDVGVRTLDATLDLQVSMNQIYGIEIDEWPARIAETALHLIDRQCNLRLIEKFGEAPERLPISESATIFVGNALLHDWSALTPPDEHTVIVGNPPFNGRRNRTATQTLEQAAVWGSRHNINLDYVTSWWLKTVEYFGSVDGRWAFVSTNSVCQGEPVAYLWEPILANGWRCRFAHRSFPWESEAQGKAAVHVSIVGFDRSHVRKPTPQLWVYPEGRRGEGIELAPANINPFLTPGPNVLIPKRSAPLNKSLPPAVYGNMPMEGQNLMVETEDYEAVMADPIAAKYVRPYIGSSELLSGAKRWCLWLVDLTESDKLASPVLKERIALSDAARRASSSPGIKKKAALYPPHLFWQIAQPTAPFLSIPIIASGRRKYFPVAHFDESYISSNATFTASDPDGFMLGVLSSLMFNTWLKMVGGRLKSDPRFSNTFVYNNFPLPPLSRSQRDAVVRAAQAILEVRSTYAGRSLSDLYEDKSMPEALQAAHAQLDAVVDDVFALKVSDPSLEDRQIALWDSYVKLTQR